ncbi:MAG: copper chaperone PCu(A)C [Chloroflexi bacterium]|nr:copper chaperone PCu(A)C [Chloroflexota bacterium]
MSSHRRRLWVTRLTVMGVLVALLSACAAFAPAGAKITTEGVWARPAAMPATAQAQPTPAPGGMGIAGPTSAVYLVIKNGGRDADRLTAARADVAQAVEIHETKMENNVMRMGQVAGVDVPASSQVELKPGSYHIMLIGVNRELKVGERFPVTLQFEKSGPITVQAEVRQG